MENTKEAKVTPLSEEEIASLNSDQTTVNEKSKDSVFVNLFSNKEYILQLYKELHPDDTEVTVKDISVKTLKAILVNTIYNDLGFVVKSKGVDRFVILVEAQSKWNPNMTLRMLFYIAETYRKYLKATKQSEHSGSKVKLPKPELYVVYTGDDKKAPETVSFSDDYFDGDSPIDLKVKILSKVDTTISGQYIGFCKVYNEQKKLFGNTLKCIEETIRICLEKGYLPNYLSEHREEVITMMSELFDEQAQRDAYNEARDHEMLNEGENIGRAAEKADIARNLLAMGTMTKEQIAAVTGLTLDQIEAISEQIKPISA